MRNWYKENINKLFIFPSGARITTTSSSSTANTVIFAFLLIFPLLFSTFQFIFLFFTVSFSSYLLALFFFCSNAHTSRSVISVAPYRVSSFKSVLNISSKSTNIVQDGTHTWNPRLSPRNFLRYFSFIFPPTNL